MSHRDRREHSSRAAASGGKTESRMKVCVEVMKSRAQMEGRAVGEGLGSSWWAAQGTTVLQGDCPLLPAMAKIPTSPVLLAAKASLVDTKERKLR